MKRAGIALVPVLLVAACATMPPPELNAARAEYAGASHGPAAHLAPADLHAAREQLAAAEKSFEDEGDTYRTRDLAYAAQRKAQLAEVRAQTIASQQSAEQAQTNLGRLQEEQVRLTSAKLTAAQQQLAVLQERLAVIGSVKQEPRGMVLTIPSNVLFAFDRYDLVPQATAKLDAVVKVLVQDVPKAHVVVEGYTDSAGSEAYNLRLSRDRAEAVRAFLVAHGVDAERVEARGFGEANPVAPNTTPEGRADNRRVEIIVQP
jgi:outer membrane protein OmpA-like peptidoglycan-associated protein